MNCSEIVLGESSSAMTLLNYSHLFATIWKGKFLWDWLLPLAQWIYQDRPLQDWRNTLGRQKKPIISRLCQAACFVVSSVKRCFCIQGHSVITCTLGSFLSIMCHWGLYLAYVPQNSYHCESQWDLHTYKNNKTHL